MEPPEQLPLLGKTPLLMKQCDLGRLDNYNFVKNMRSLGEIVKTCFFG